MQIEIVFNQPKPPVNAITFYQAQQFAEINKLKDELQKKIETACFLSGGRKGAWGRRTMSDEKRDIAIEKLRAKINQLERKLKP